MPAPPVPPPPRQPRNQDEEVILRDSIVEISKRFGLDVLVLRNEANACTKLLQACEREVLRALEGWGADSLVKKALRMAFERLHDSIKFGLGVGSADVIVVAWGRFLALEFKVGRTGQTPEQVDFEGACERAGGLYRVVRSVEEALAAVEACRPV